MSFSCYNLQLLPLLIFVDHSFGCIFCKFSAQPFPPIIEVRPRLGFGSGKYQVSLLKFLQCDCACWRLLTGLPWKPPFLCLILVWLPHQPLLAPVPKLIYWRWIWNLKSQIPVQYISTLSIHFFAISNLYLDSWKFWSFLSLKYRTKTLPHTLGKSFLLPRHFAIHSALDLCYKDQQKQSTTLEWCYTPGKLSH